MLAQQRPDFEFRPMTAADVGNAHELSIALKWPHRLEDWAMLQRVAQGFVAVHNGRLIGSAFACHQGEFSTIGPVIVSDDYQGKGIGRKLMELAVGCVAPARRSSTPRWRVRRFTRRWGLSVLARSSSVRGRRNRLAPPN